MVGSHLLAVTHAQVTDHLREPGVEFDGCCELIWLFERLHWARDVR